MTSLPDALAVSAPDFDITVPHPARVYDYLLGGKDNYVADRQAAEEILIVAPELAASARANRAFLGRAVRYLAGEAGIRQFLDIGTGVPAAGNTHEVAQAITPQARDLHPPEVTATAAEVYGRGPASLTLRPKAAVEKFFDGFTLVEPGLVQAPQWRPDTPGADLGRIGVYAGAGAKK